jgi:hypothetical protein
MEAEEILRKARLIKEIKDHPTLSPEVKEYLIQKAVDGEGSSCPKCGDKIFFPFWANPTEIKESGHLGFACASRDCGTTGIETDIKWVK